MVTVTVKKEFIDIEADRFRLPGQTFEVSERRANELKAKLGDEYVSCKKAPAKSKE